MLRAAVSRAAQLQELQAAAALQNRGFVSMSVEFSEDVSTSVKSNKGSTSIVSAWNSTKSATEQTMKLLQGYKSVGDSNKEPFLKFHNPRTFEDLDKPIPNFKKFGLKAGEVPKFFDNVLAKRAGDATDAKTQWWARRKAEVEDAGKDVPANFGVLPVPAWQMGKPVPLDSLKAVTDKYYNALQPSRKLRLPTMPAQMTDALGAYTKSLGLEGALGELKTTIMATLAERAVVEENGKVLPGAKFLTQAEAARKLNDKRAEVHARWVKMWAKRVFTGPEQALVPLKERDALLASSFQDISTKYSELIKSVGRGTVSYGERMANVVEADNFLMARDKENIKSFFPVTEKDQEALALAAKLEDRSYALERLLGPAVRPEGSGDRLLSEEVAELTAHLFTPDRLMYSEGMRLAQKYREQEDALREEHGADADIRALQHAPRTPAQALFARLAELEKLGPELAAEKAAVADHPYLHYAASKKEKFLSNPSNLAFEEVQYPALTEEMFAIEWAELEEKERWIDEAEEEELWHMTLLAQARHIHQHGEFDLPAAAVAHMDPLLYKKLDWETTHGQDLLHHEVFQAADCEQGQYLKDLYALENMSHHFLPLIRYRRHKYRALHGFYPAEVSNVAVKATPAK